MATPREVAVTPGSGAPSASARVESTTISALLRHLANLGIEHAFAVSGGGKAVTEALRASQIRLHFFRHEGGAAFAAAEAYFTSGKPSLVLSTTGRGVLNALTGIAAGKWDGSKIVLISGATDSPHRGRWAIQETTSYTFPQDALYSAGPFFDFGVRMEDPAEFAEVARRLRLGLTRRGGFIAHICVPLAVQARRFWRPRHEAHTSIIAQTISALDVSPCVEAIGNEPFAIWVGFGAREAAASVCELVEHSGAPVFCSPKAKGIIPEDHPQLIGVTGLGGHSVVTKYMVGERPSWVLVLGTRLGEATSFWDTDMHPAVGFIHVDLDPDVPGVAFPDVRTISVQADVGQFARAMIAGLPGRELQWSPVARSGQWEGPAGPLTARCPVRPQALMDAIQRVVIDRSDAVILAECGNAFAWCNHHLLFPSPGRYRVSTLFGSMGHAAAGVVGAAIGRKGKAIAVVGDGSMLMNSEISSAVQNRASAGWIVLNDAGYGMCRHGQQAQGLATADLDCPEVNFVDLAKAVGADGVRVSSEDGLDDALGQLIATDEPFVVDVKIDPDQTSPLLKRFESLIKQGSTKDVAGWSKR